MTPTLTRTNNNLADLAAFASYFVTKELSDTLPEASLDTTLDLVLGLKTLRSGYVDYLHQLEKAAVEITNIRRYLSAEDWQGLNTNKRLYLESCVRKQVAQINAGVLASIDWLTKQLITLSPDDETMQALLARRARQYPTYASKPMRKARRVASRQPAQ